MMPKRSVTWCVWCWLVPATYMVGAYMATRFAQAYANAYAVARERTGARMIHEHEARPLSAPTLPPARAVQSVPA